MTSKADELQEKTHAFRIEEKSLYILDIETSDVKHVDLSDNRGEMLNHIPLEVYHQAVHGKSEQSIVWFDGNRDEFQIIR